MKQLTKQQFLEGYELGYITDLVSIGTKVYGKDPRGKQGKYEVVWCEV